MTWAMVRHAGYLWKARKYLGETDEQAHDRAWHIATTMTPQTPLAERESVSRQWANEKYCGMTYPTR